MHPKDYGNKRTKRSNRRDDGQHIITFKASGLSLLEYCRDKCLSVHRFNYWYYQRKKRRPASRPKGFSLVKPLDDQISAPGSPSRYPTVEVTLASGTASRFL